MKELLFKQKEFMSILKSIKRYKYTNTFLKPFRTQYKASKVRKNEA